MVRLLWIYTTKASALKGLSSGRVPNHLRNIKTRIDPDTADFEVRVDEENKEVSVLACPEKTSADRLMRSERRKTLRI